MQIAYSFDDDHHLHVDGRFHGDHDRHDDVDDHDDLHDADDHDDLHDEVLEPGLLRDEIHRDSDSRWCPYFRESISLCSGHVCRKKIHRERTCRTSLFGYATKEMGRVAQHSTAVENMSSTSVVCSSAGLPAP